MLKRCKDDACSRLSTVKQLLQSRKTTEAVVHFLTVTRVDPQTRAQEHEEEEQRRHKEQAWDLEKDRLEGDEGEGERGGP